MTKTIEEFKDETEAEIAADYFANCGCSVKRKGKVLKVTGEESIIDYLYRKFVFNVLLGS